MLDFFVTDINGETTHITDIVSFELSRSVDTACDGLRLNFVSKNLLDEVVKVAVYDGGQLVFNGYADTQRESADKNGWAVFIYARSSACLLTDNEAKPVTYTCPSAFSLYYQNARQFGFECDFPYLYCDYDYQVGKGVSCYGAINDFVCGITGYNIDVDPYVVIKLASPNTLAKLDKNCVMSEKRSINRGDLITCIDYKATGDNAYDHHLKSRYLEQRQINKRQKINLSTLPDWQKEFTVKNRLYSLCKDYYTIELMLRGYHHLDLYNKVEYDSARFGRCEDYYVSKIVVKNSDDGCVTKITLNKNIDMQEINYVVK